MVTWVQLRKYWSRGCNGGRIERTHISAEPLLPLLLFGPLDLRLSQEFPLSLCGRGAGRAAAAAAPAAAALRALPRRAAPARQGLRRRAPREVEVRERQVRLLRVDFLGVCSS